MIKFIMPLFEFAKQQTQQKQVDSSFRMKRFFFSLLANGTAVVLDLWSDITGGTPAHEWPLLERLPPSTGDEVLVKWWPLPPSHVCYNSFLLLRVNYGNHRASDNDAREEGLDSAVIVFIGKRVGPISRSRLRCTELRRHSLLNNWTLIAH